MLPVSYAKKENRDELQTSTRQKARRKPSQKDCVTVTTMRFSVFAVMLFTILFFSSNAFATGSSVHIRDLASSDAENMAEIEKIKRYGIPGIKYPHHSDAELKYAVEIGGTTAMFADYYEGSDGHEYVYLWRHMSENGWVVAGMVEKVPQSGRWYSHCGISHGSGSIGEPASLQGKSDSAASGAIARVYSHYLLDHTAHDSQAPR